MFRDGTQRDILLIMRSDIITDRCYYPVVRIDCHIIGALQQHTEALHQNLLHL